MATNNFVTKFKLDTNWQMQSKNIYAIAIQSEIVQIAMFDGRENE